MGIEIVKTEEAEKNGIKYLNINASDSEVERNPDIVRLCADAGILEYVKSKTGHWIVHPKGIYAHLVCDKCLCNAPYDCETNYCPNCGAKMIEPQESEV